MQLLASKWPEEWTTLGQKKSQQAGNVFLQRSIGKKMAGGMSAGQATALDATFRVFIMLHCYLITTECAQTPDSSEGPVLMLHGVGYNVFDSSHTPIYNSVPIL